MIREILEIREGPQSVEKQRESDYFLVVLDNLSGASFRGGDFAPREPVFGLEFWDTKF